MISKLIKILLVSDAPVFHAVIGFFCPNVQDNPDGKEIKIPDPAFYFPDYYDPFEGCEDQEDYEDRYSEVRVTGNDTRNVRVNEFFRKYIPILKLFKKKELAEDAYHIVLSDFLKRLPNP